MSGSFPHIAKPITTATPARNDSPPPPFGWSFRMAESVTSTLITR